MIETKTPEVYYRPTIRCDKRFEAYVEELFQSTNLDRNQIIRAALFAAPFSGTFRKLIEDHLVGSKTDCPTPSWNMNDHALWQKQSLRQEIEAS